VAVRDEDGGAACTDVLELEKDPRRLPAGIDDDRFRRAGPPDDVAVRPDRFDGKLNDVEAQRGS
jgi:hypothetical protein